MTKSLANIHDIFFKGLLSDPATAGQFFKERLPAEISALLVPEPPELLPGSFIDEEFAEHHSDLLFRSRLTADGRDVLVWLLIEHKSAPDPLVALQLLRYMIRIWDPWFRGQEKLP